MRQPGRPQAVRSVPRQRGRGRTSLRRCGIVEETELGVDTPSIEDLLTGSRHALTDLALL